MANAARELGKAIGSIAKDQSTIAQNISPEDPSAQLNLYGTERYVVHSRMVALKHVYDTSSFILDHPVQGEINSSVYQLDGGYASGQTDIPLWTFNENSVFIEHLYDDRFVDAASTTATVDTGTFTVTF